MASNKPVESWNQTSVTEFVLTGFSVNPENWTLLFVTALLVYLLTLAGNLTIIALIWIDKCLQTPMYFFLGNLSFVEICYTSTTVPKMLWNLLSKEKTISFIGCALQMYFFVTLGGTECVLLSAMAYDRYAAICHPLSYTRLINQQMRRGLLAGSWAIGNFNSIVNTAMVFSLSYCNSNEINHFFCDIPPLLRISCSDTFVSQLVTFTISGCVIIVPFCLTLLSYILIVFTVLKIHTVHGRMKAFSTCASHLTVVSIFFGTIIYTYIRPSSVHSIKEDHHVSVLYAIITPMLNPLIYSLRNKEVQGALQRVLKKNR
ncbi:olfactory receptor 5F1 [Anolis carolinensis]|uniref:olfactory receptor 5F1 n=1 Tax=Anolis carolinensis TaxID=28377 RepID=UPI00046269D9|nr:PREDICTED: olfactory receptor 5F1-like [Anolis carolinensis]|eukprot:XP_008114756.1 PREDICTED: olfactory receptor 5F1-like [Anolis carolinensis]